MQGFVWLCVLAILIVGPHFQGLGARLVRRPWCACASERHRGQFAVAGDAGEVAVFRELEIDFALFRWAPACPLSTDACVGMSHLSVVEVPPGRSRRMR